VEQLKDKNKVSRFEQDQALAFMQDLYIWYFGKPFDPATSDRAEVSKEKIKEFADRVISKANEVFLGDKVKLGTISKEVALLLEGNGSLKGLQALSLKYFGTVELVDNAAKGGIDLGQGNYLKVVATDAAGMPQFDPVQIQQLQKDLRGLVPVPVGVPQAVDMKALLGV
jgi:hypothetical protein